MTSGRPHATPKPCPGARPPIRLDGAARACFGLALSVLALPGHAADSPPKARIRPQASGSPPSRRQSTSARPRPPPKDDSSDAAARGPRPKAATRGSASTRTTIFEALSNPPAEGRRGSSALIFLVVGFDLPHTGHPSHRPSSGTSCARRGLQNEAMLALAEKGVVPPAQAAEALAADASAASVAPQVYQQAGGDAQAGRLVGSAQGCVIMTMIGLAFLFLLDDRKRIARAGSAWYCCLSASVYVVLWWLESRHLEQAGRGPSHEWRRSRRKHRVMRKPRSRPMPSSAVNDAQLIAPRPGQ